MSEHPAVFPQEVYPRVCGGTGRPVVAAGGQEGLSPRVRGNPWRPIPPHPNDRSIPACAGEPTRYRHPMIYREVYPRVCGGTAGGPLKTGRAGGLSPRVRGNLDHIVSGGKTIRSIPACAGEPVASSAKRRFAGVYPRVCGGTLEELRMPRPARGLSPRVRGNRPYLRGRRDADRSIPACAGEPGRILVPDAAGGVYPRVCGGTDGDAGDGVAGQGLSPRVRGNQIRPWATSRRQRSIPRVRGNLLAPPFPFRSHRSIPACAGEPASQIRPEQLV